MMRKAYGMDAIGDEKSIWDGCYNIRGKHIIDARFPFKVWEDLFWSSRYHVICMGFKQPERR